jgi:adenylate cyclase
MGEETSATTAREVTAESAAERARTAWLAHIKQEFVAPLAAIREMATVLLQDARDRGNSDLLNDLQSMLASTRQLHDVIEPLLDGRLVPNDEIAKRIRHELRNPLTNIIGLCELWIESAGELLLEGFAPDFRKLHQLGTGMLARQEDLVGFSKRFATEGPNGHADGVPDFIRDLIGAMPKRSSSLDASIPPACILVADDNETNRDLVSRLLRRDGHDVTVVANGRTALDLLRSQPFDLVLLDVLMPEVNGFEILREITGDTGLRRLPVIMLSAFDDMECIARFIEMGAEDYLLKPFHAALLKARIDACLQKRRLHKRELEQFFPAEVVNQLLFEPRLLEQGQKVDVSVLFCDIRGFSRVSERLSAGETMRWLSGVMEVLAACIFRHQGVLVDFIGDELMAFWGAPQPQPDHARRACRAALDMLAALPELNRQWERTIRTEMSLGIGVHSGPAHVGNTGIRRRFKYGPHGNVVNLASRVQGATKFLKSKLLITGATRQYLDESISARRLATVHAVNMSAPVDLFEIAPAEQPDWPRLKDEYERALELFESQKLKESAEALSELIRQNGAQGPELFLMSRAMESLVQPSRWSRVWELPGK